MSNSKFIIFPSLVALLLIATQFLLIRKNARVSSENFENLVSLRIAEIGQDLEDAYYCYRSNAQQIIPNNTPFFLLHPSLDSSKGMDTLISHSQPDGYSFSTINYDVSTKINLRFDFEFQPIDTLKNNQNVKYARYVQNLYKNYIEDSSGIRLIDTLLVDSLITQKIRSIPTAINCQYNILHDEHIVFGHSSLENQASMRSEVADIYQSRLLPKLQLQLFFPSSFWARFLEQGYFYLVSIGLTLLILLLFIRNFQVTKKVSKANALKAEFISLMTHEFNTPVTNLSLATESFKPNLPKTRVTQLMDIIRMETERIKRNIKTLFQINKLAADELELIMEVHSIHELITMSAEVQEIALDEKNGRLQKVFDAKHFLVKCDSGHVLNVLANHIENSIKYSKEAPDILVSTRNIKGTIVVTIKDTGIGMKSMDIDQAFDRYYRSDDLFVQSNSGLGLGLYYSKKIIEAHGGTIQITSDGKYGTTVIITLPLSTTDG